MTDAVIQLNNLNKSFNHSSGSNHVLKDINLKVNSGEMVAIVGQSGSGKSTLLSILGLLELADKGSYELCNQNTRELSEFQLSQLRNQHIGWVFQNFNLIADMTVVENLTAPLRFNKKVKPSEYSQLIQDVLSKVDLTDKKDFFPDELSGGQQQRVAIARALICKPDILLCDEPTGNLDSENSQKIMDLLCELNKEGRTVLIITHDERVALCCQRAYKMSDGILCAVHNQDLKRVV